MAIKILLTAVVDKVVLATGAVHKAEAQGVECRLEATMVGLRLMVILSRESIMYREAGEAVLFIDRSIMLLKGTLSKAPRVVVGNTARRLNNNLRLV